MSPRWMSASREASLRRRAADSERRLATSPQKSGTLPGTAPFRRDGTVLSRGDRLMSDTERADMQNVGELERVASALGGAVLLGYGVARPSALNTLLAIGGALLVERALTGRCNLYHTLGIDTRHHRDALPRATRG